jgi:DNA mismatch repair protein MutH
VDPPKTESELWKRARALAGVRVADLAAREAFVVDGDAVRTKGKIGELLERALGATGTGAEMDFPHLAIELKTVPLENGKPAESTFVCALPLMNVDRAEWKTSWVRKKLSRVLWMPIHERDRIGAPVIWSPSADEERELKEDFDEIIGRIAIGDIEDLTARVGRHLQLRPKAATGSVRTSAPARDGEVVATVPRGFYLRAKFVESVVVGSSSSNGGS